VYIVTCSFLRYLDEQAEPSEDDIKDAQNELLKATARYQLRTNIIENVLVVNPILKAVHAGSNATTIEQSVTMLLGGCVQH
jgi:hypothetical protein